MSMSCFSVGIYEPYIDILYRKRNTKQECIVSVPVLRYDTIPKAVIIDLTACRYAWNVYI